MSKLVLLFVCVAVFQLANALQCYHCEKEACEKDAASWQKSVCSKPINQNDSPACLKHIYKDAASHKEAVTRKCVFKTKDQPFKCNTNVGEEVSCEICDSDLCNSASSINFSIVAASGVLVALFLPKFFA